MLSRILYSIIYGVKRRILVKKYGEEKVLIAELRMHFHAFGYDTSRMTDEQIKSGVISFGKALGSTGISANQAMKSLKTAFM